MDLENAYYDDRIHEVLNERILSGGALHSGSKTSRPKRRVKRRSASKRRVKKRSASKRRVKRRSGSKRRVKRRSHRRGGVLLGSGMRRRSLKPARGRRGHGSKRMGRRRSIGGTMAGGMRRRPLTEYQKFMKKKLLEGYAMAEVARMWRNGKGGAMRKRRAAPRRKRVSGSKTSRPRRRHY